MMYRRIYRYNDVPTMVTSFNENLREQIEKTSEKNPKNNSYVQSEKKQNNTYKENEISIHNTLDTHTPVISKNSNLSNLLDLSILKRLEFDDILLLGIILLLLYENNDDYVLLIALGFVFLSGLL